MANVLMLSAVIGVGVVIFCITLLVVAALLVHYA
jgi:hypothetical protein